MPTLTQLSESHVQVTITEKEIMEMRAYDNNSPSIGQVAQSMIARTLGLEENEQYWISDIKDAEDASYDEYKREYKWVYKIKDDADLVF